MAYGTYIQVLEYAPDGRRYVQATPKQQEVLELLMEGHSQEEISVILEIPGSTVRMRLHLAKKRVGKGAA